MFWRAFLSVFALLLLMGGTASAQDNGSVSGVVVSSWNAAPLSGVTVTLRGTTLAAQADAGGKFELKNVPPGNQVLRFSKSGYATATVTEVRVLPGQTTTVNGNLRPEFYDLEEYEVTAEEFTEQTEKIMFDRQQSGAMVDAIGSDQFTKTGASDAGQIVARVTGVSVVGGKYVVVRGLSDRYSRTLLNGLEVPSADPYKLSPQLDLFPAAMIERISVTKTFMPDQPGATGGGMIDIITKSFPEKPFVKATFGTSYNPNSNLKNNFLADPNTSMDMFALPKGPKPLPQSLFGLTDPPKPPGPAIRNETLARADARREQANEVQALNEKLGTANFAGVEKTSPLNSSFAASAGETVPVFGHNLGAFAGVNYKRDFLLIENAEVNRYNSNGTPAKQGTETRGNVLTSEGANVNLGYDLSPYAQFGFNFMLANTTDEETRHDTYNYVQGRDDTLEQWQMHYTERQVLNYQLNGHHDLRALADSDLDWVVGIADSTQNEPDNRFMNYFVTPDGQPTFGDAATPFPQYPSRYFREINEQSLNYRVDWTVPLAFMNEDSKVKTGYSSSSVNREFKEQYFSYNGSQGFDVNNPNSYLNNPDYLKYVATPAGGIRTNYTFSRYVSDTYSSPYTASLDVNAVYLMADIGVLSWLRLIGGARLENTDMRIDAGPNGSSVIDQANLLPAVSAVITFVKNFDLRLSYGETVSRPSFREKAPVLNYLPDLGVTALGNPNLEMSNIKSYDARLEWFPAPGDVISAGVFYKQITKPIELYSRSADDQQVTWINRDNAPADVTGVEFELRKNLEFMSAKLKGWTMGANVSLIESSTKLTEAELFAKRSVNPHASDTRPLYDQSPYIINLDLNYERPASGTSFVIGANMTGARLVLAQSLGPDIYEHSPVSLDASLAQKFGKIWTMRFSVRNILDPEFRQTYGSGYDGNIYQSYKRGRTFSTSLTAEF